MLTIDGSCGEGGGQIIRSSVALSLVTGKPFRVFNVRANRAKPGLQRQHLTAVTAAAAIGNATLTGATLGSGEFTFVPGEVKPGEYTFKIGTAGSTMLVLQAVLPPLVLAGWPSLLTFEGGTHNVHAPPFEFIETAFLPLVNRMGCNVSVELERYGFYPPGGGQFNVYVEPAGELMHLELLERGPVISQRARALVVNLPSSIAERELTVVNQQLGWTQDQLELESSRNAISWGNVLTLSIKSESVTEVFTGIGQRGVRAEIVAHGVIDEVMTYLETEAPVGQYLADQLLLPMSLLSGGTFTTGPLSLHTTTNIEIIRKFLPVEIKTTPLAQDLWKVSVLK